MTDWMERITVTTLRDTDPLMAAVYALRHEVFVIEQGIPEELERDEDDKVATHLAAVVDGRVVGTLRIVHHGKTAKIGRMAVAASSRKRGVGKQLMKFAADQGRASGVDEIVLGAQVPARDFYKRLGYIAEGPVFDDAGVPHVMMRRKLVRSLD